MTTSTPALTAGDIPLPGYRLMERIGVGGFGEVWRATAPGGLLKAIKFIHAQVHQGRAEREMRSLERLRDVRHPFLVALERFEIIDGRLLVIMELADNSLDQVLQSCRQQGSCGIARDQLLDYLDDAAEALDHLNLECHLQHLDIKPGNLLVLGRHVKIADFGLIKHLEDVEQSLIGGLTPIYAPPELFDGRPTTSTDQYSLAIVYQELLTGHRPFTGRTLAQLASQHVHVAPWLEPLPASDRAVIARALHKDPRQRWASCGELLAQLRQVTQRAPRKPAQQTPAASPVSANTATPRSGYPFAYRRAAPQLEADGDAQRSTDSGSPAIKTAPALFIGLGGLGCKVLSELKSQLAPQVDQQLIDWLLVDSDNASLARHHDAPHGAGFTAEQCLWCPLKSSQEYRKLGQTFRGLSRRWLFNVPRSQQTEGIRPLGRLALLSHSARVQQAVQRVIQQLGERALSSDLAPRVYLVASLAGGTGSGMLIDLACLVRDTMDRCGMPTARVLPFLFSGPFHDPFRRPLLAANVGAALTELQRFSAGNAAYFGDQPTGWPSLTADRWPLSEPYLVSPVSHEESAWGSARQTVVDYLALDSSSAGEALASLRNATPPECWGSLRSCGVLPIVANSPTAFCQTGLTIALQSLDRWLVDGSNLASDPPTADSQSSPALHSRLEHLGQSIPKLLDSVLARWLSELMHVPPDSQLALVETKSHDMERPLSVDGLANALDCFAQRIVEACGDRLTADQVQVESNTLEFIHATIQLQLHQILDLPETGILQELLREARAEAEWQLRTLLVDGELSLAGAAVGADWIERRWQTVAEQARQEAEQLARRLCTEFADGPTSEGDSPVGSIDSQNPDSGLEASVTNCPTDSHSTALTELDWTEDRIKQLARGNLLAIAFSSLADSLDAVAANWTNPAVQWRGLGPTVIQVRDQIQTMHEALGAPLFKPGASDSAALTHCQKPIQSAMADLLFALDGEHAAPPERIAAQLESVVYDALGQALAALPDDVAVEPMVRAIADLAAKLPQLAPPLLRSAGRHRQVLLHIGGPGAEAMADSIHRMTGDYPALRSAHTPFPALVHEAQDIPLHELIDVLRQCLPDPELIRRLTSHEFESSTTESPHLMTLPISEQVIQAIEQIG